MFSSMDQFLGLLVTTIAPTAILLVGVIDDLRSRKFHNWLFMVCTAVAVILVVAVSGISQLPLALIGFAAGFALLMPLVMLNIIGGGDMKLMAAFGLLAGWNNVLTVLIHSFVWGAVFGVLRVVVNGQGKVLAMNMISLVTFKGRQGLELHRMPFTIALFMGWLSVLVLQGAR